MGFATEQIMPSNYPDNVNMLWDRMFTEEVMCPVCEGELVEDQIAPQISCTQCDWFVDMVQE